jgi:hypothetical protein
LEYKKMHVNEFRLEIHSTLNEKPAAFVSKIPIEIVDEFCCHLTRVSR